MAYEDLFVLYWEQVKESAQEGRFAKLTMAKTIGKPNLRNVFLRPIYSENGFTVLLKLRYRSRDTADVENELTLEEAFDVLKSYLQKPFFLPADLPQIQLSTPGLSSARGPHPGCEQRITF